jgi:hypothetical protein
MAGERHARELGAPTGTIPRGKIGGGGQWDRVNRFDAVFVTEGQKHGVPPAMLKSMMIVETGGNNVSDPFGATGVMQIKPRFWDDRAQAAGYDLATDAGQIGMAAAILGGSVPNVRGDDPTERFLYTYYPVLRDGQICYDCRGESGHTPQMYLDDIALYTGLIEAAACPPEVIEEAGALVAGRNALARPAPWRGGAGEGRQLTAGQRLATTGYTDQGQDVGGSSRWFRLAAGQEWVHASGGVYQPASGAAPGFTAQAGQLTVGGGRASVRPGPSRESGEPLRTLSAGSVCAVDGYTDQGQAVKESARWYRLAGNAGWVHASGGTVAAG